MATGMITDYSWGLKAEATYGTPVTVDRWNEFLNSSGMKYDPTRVQGQGLRVGSLVARSGRRVTPLVSGSGQYDTELVSKGLGTTLALAFGNGASTVVSGATYQQLFTLENTMYMPSATMQYTVPSADASGTLVAHTANGVVIPSFEIDCPNGNIATLKCALNARDVLTATAYATPSYPAEPVSLFHFAQWSVGLGGAVTAPTTTALASGGTATTNIRSFNLKVDNNLDLGRNNGGGGGKKSAPTVGKRKITGNITVEFNATTLRDAFMADTPLPLLLDFDTGVALSTGTERLQIVLPEIKLDGELPPISDGVSLQSIDFEVLDNGVATQPIWLVIRTADTAL